MRKRQLKIGMAVHHDTTNRHLGTVVKIVGETAMRLDNPNTPLATIYETKPCDCAALRGEGQ